MDWLHHIFQKSPEIALFLSLAAGYFIGQINFGKFQVIVVPLLRSLKGVHEYVPNYGWSVTSRATRPPPRRSSSSTGWSRLDPLRAGRPAVTIDGLRPRILTPAALAGQLNHTARSGVVMGGVSGMTRMSST